MFLRGLMPAAAAAAAGNHDAHAHTRHSHGYGIPSFQVRDSELKTRSPTLGEDTVANQPSGFPDVELGR